MGELFPGELSVGEFSLGELSVVELILGKLLLGDLSGHVLLHVHKMFSCSERKLCRAICTPHVVLKANEHERICRTANRITAFWVGFYAKEDVTTPNALGVKPNQPLLFRHWVSKDWTGF